MAIKSKSLSSAELSEIEDEWNDSTVVQKLLGHIHYLTDSIIRLTGEAVTEESDSG